MIMLVGYLVCSCYSLYFGISLKYSVYKFSCYPRIILDRNSLPTSLLYVYIMDIDSFKTALVALTLTQQELTKAHCITWRKLFLSPTTSSQVGLYGYGNAGSAASQVWRATGDHRFGVQEVPGSNPGGNPHFWRCQFQMK